MVARLGIKPDNMPTPRSNRPAGRLLKVSAPCGLIDDRSTPCPRDRAPASASVSRVRDAEIAGGPERRLVPVGPGWSRALGFPKLSTHNAEYL